MNTIIPAQPGFFVVYPSGIDPILAWEITPVVFAGRPEYIVRPITLRGHVGDDVLEVMYRTERGSTITVEVRV